MNFIVKPMERDEALEISSWKYDPPYDFYNMDDSQETLYELLDGSYFKIVDEHQSLVGFCCYGKSAQVPIGIQYGAYPENGALDVGLRCART